MGEFIIKSFILLFFLCFQSYGATEQGNFAQSAQAGLELSKKELSALLQAQRNSTLPSQLKKIEKKLLEIVAKYDSLNSYFSENHPLNPSFNLDRARDAARAQGEIYEIDLDMRTLLFSFLIAKSKYQMYKKNKAITLQEKALLAYNHLMLSIEHFCDGNTSAADREYMSFWRATFHPIDSFTISAAPLGLSRQELSKWSEDRRRVSKRKILNWLEPLLWTHETMGSLGDLRCTISQVSRTLDLMMNQLYNFDRNFPKNHPLHFSFDIHTAALKASEEGEIYRIPVDIPLLFWSFQEVQHTDMLLHAEWVDEQKMPPHLIGALMSAYHCLLHSLYYLCSEDEEKAFQEYYNFLLLQPHLKNFPLKCPHCRKKVWPMHHEMGRKKLPPRARSLESMEKS